MDNRCVSCKRCLTYVLIDNPENIIHICGDEWQEEDEGLFMAPEVTDFDASECLLFVPKEDE